MDRPGKLDSRNNKIYFSTRALRYAAASHVLVAADAVAANAKRITTLRETCVDARMRTCRVNYVYTRIIRNACMIPDGRVSKMKVRKDKRNFDPGQFMLFEI